MRAVIQRTITPAKIVINGKEHSRILKGLVVFLGIEDADEIQDLEWLAKKIVQLRVFADELGKMNKSVQDIGGSLLVISQFTLYGNVKKGNRPSFIRSAHPEYAKMMYEKFISYVENIYKLDVQSGIFAADMKVEFINDGPVTIFIDTKQREL